LLVNERLFWAIILLTAAVIDYFIEYPNKVHPVVFTGKLISFFDKHRISKKPIYEFIYGMISIILIIFLWILILYSIGFTPIYIRFIIYVYILKSTFSIGALSKAIKKCQVDDTEILRNNVAQIVSRNVKTLDRDHLLSAAFESGSENIVDSVISPVFYFIFFGIFGAVIYRVINTADAMIGYRSENYEYFGKFAARADDALNFIPSRIFGLLVFLISPSRVSRNLKRYRKLKINGMYSMATVAGLFNVMIEKIDYYRIDGPRFPDIRDLKRLEKFIYVISYFFILMAITEVIIIGPWWS